MNDGAFGEGCDGVLSAPPGCSGAKDVKSHT